MPYLECLRPDRSGITVELFHNINEIPYLEKNSYIPMHQHRFYEMTLILRGTCQHFYRGSCITLMPGDLFLIPPNQIHSYRFHDSISLCNCQFYRQELDISIEKFISDIEYTNMQKNSSLNKRFKDMQAFDAGDGHASLWHTGDINSQGIIHLNRLDRNLLVQELNTILNEQMQRKFGFERAKQILLENILIQIKRIQIAQFENASKISTSGWKEEMIYSILNTIENDVAKEYDFNEMARLQNITPSYFRSIFKNITGLSPIEYLNRVRVLRSLELLQITQLSISEIAAEVGIYDSNYFSRIFKQFIGYPPSYFKSIRNESTSIKP